MNDIQQRLAATMREAVAEARPPDRLMDLIMRRHRRHRVRVAAVSVTAIAALALAAPLAIPPLTGVRLPATGPLSSSAPTYPASHSPQSGHDSASGKPRHEPAIVSQNCADQTAGTYAKDWQRRSIRAGPLWLVDVRPASATRDGTSPLPFADMPVNVRDGTHVRITVAGPARTYFRLLFGGPGTGRYTLRDGHLSVSFTGCRPGHDWGVYPGYTQFWGGFVIAKRPACVSLDVWTGARKQPARITFAVGAIRCGNGG